MTKFIPGKTYKCRDDCFYHEIIKRTAKTVTIKVHGDVVRRKIIERYDTEEVFPYGRYSMAPVLKSNRLCA